MFSSFIESFLLANFVKFYKQFAQRKAIFFFIVITDYLLLGAFSGWNRSSIDL